MTSPILSVHILFLLKRLTLGHSWTPARQRGPICWRADAQPTLGILLGKGDNVVVCTLNCGAAALFPSPESQHLSQAGLYYQMGDGRLTSSDCWPRQKYLYTSMRLLPGEQTASCGAVRCLMANRNKQQGSAQVYRKSPAQPTETTAANQERGWRGR